MNFYNEINSLIEAKQKYQRAQGITELSLVADYMANVIDYVLTSLIIKDTVSAKELLSYTCPQCQNEEFSPSAKFCRICGKEVD